MTQRSQTGDGEVQNVLKIALTCGTLVFLAAIFQAVHLHHQSALKAPQ